MNAVLLTRVIRITIKCIPFFIALIFLYSCESSTKDLKNEVIMNYLLPLESSIDSLNQKVDSLNYRLLQLEENAANQEIVTEMQAEGPADSRNVQCKNCNGTGIKQETCGKCRGSGWDENGRSTCLSCGSFWSSSKQGKGYVNRTCSACDGNRTVIE
jgi:hypothetical protein